MKLRAKLIDILLSFKSKCPVVSFEVDGDAEALERLKDKDLDIEIKIHREHRSKDANAMLWACLGDIAKELDRDPWSLYLNALKDYGKYTTLMVRQDAVEDVKKQWREVMEVGDTIMYDTDGDAVRMVYLNCYFGSSTYDTKEFSTLLNGVIEDMRDLGLTPPPSGDMKRALEQWEAVHDKAKRSKEAGQGIPK